MLFENLINPETRCAQWLSKMILIKETREGWALECV
jgi:hypothetical protein